MSMSIHELTWLRVVSELDVRVQDEIGQWPAMNRALGGRFFPGVHHRALFSVTDSQDHVTVVMRSLDLVARVEVEGHPIARLAPGSVFASLAEASDFFRGGSVGFSATDRCDCHASVRLITERWSVEPLAVEHVGIELLRRPGRVC